MRLEKINRLKMKWAETGIPILVDNWNEAWMGTVISRMVDGALDSSRMEI